MKSKTLIIIALGLILLVSGCTQEQNNGTADDTTPNQDIEDDSMEQDDTTKTEPDDSQNSNPGTDNDSDSGKMSSPYACTDILLLSAMQSVFGSDAEVLRKPAPFGRTISYVSCNVQASGTAAVQIEFHETTTMEAALESLEDEALQIESQLFDSEKTEGSIGAQSYVVYSTRSNETRVLFVDNDGATPVFVIVKSIPGTEVTQSTVTRVAEKIEELI